MNDPARQILELAAEEFDRQASAAETEADLWREAAQHARRAEIALAIDATHRAVKCVAQQNPRLGVELIQSIERRDPDEWRRARSELQRLTHDGQIHSLAELDPPRLLLFIQLHRVECEIGQSCCLIQAARDRISSWRT